MRQPANLWKFAKVFYSGEERESGLGACAFFSTTVCMYIWKGIGSRGIATALGIYRGGVCTVVQIPLYMLRLLWWQEMAFGRISKIIHIPPGDLISPKFDHLVHPATHHQLNIGFGGHNKFQPQWGGQIKHSATNAKATSGQVAISQTFGHI